MNQLERRVLDAIDLEALLSFLCRLLAIPSCDGQENAAQELVAEQMSHCGLQVDRWEVDLASLRRHAAHCQEIDRSAALGVVGRIGQSGPADLIFNGHVDVVPAGDPARWSYPPFQGTLTDRRVYGRGSADMKGGLSCALFAAKAIRDAGVELASPLQVQSVFGEEDGGGGSLATLLRGHRASAAVIMEPTSLQVVTAQAGALNFRLRVPGKAAHGSMRTEGVSAFERFLPVHRAIQELESQRNATVEHPLLADQALPYPISIGRLSAGNWASSVPEELVCEGRYGVAIGESLADARQEFEGAIERAAQADSWLCRHPPIVEWWGGQFEPAETGREHRLVQSLSRVVQDLTTREPHPRGVTYGADMRLLVNEGRIPTVLFGPGDVRVAHQTDEFVPIDDLYLAVRALALLALRYCGIFESRTEKEES